MKTSTALSTAMERNNLKDAHIAVMLGVDAQTVRFWRREVQQPRVVHFQRLRKGLPGFAELVDQDDYGQHAA